MKYAKWQVAPSQAEHRADLEQAGLPPLLATVLAARGVASAREAELLLGGGPEELPSPLLMRDMDRAAARIDLALERGELVAVYGDYDVDGITSTCLLTDLLSRRGARVTSYIPDRLEEGYGLNREAVDLLKEQGVSLIITVDCGITAVDEVDYAAGLGIDVVITDHHECKDALPRAALEEYADLTAVGTVADVMSMTGLNRMIVRRGLEQLSRHTRLGLSLLIHETGLDDKPITAVSVGYTLAPRINAAGRMGQARLALELLLTRDSVRGVQLAQRLCELNRERQTIEGDIFQQCVDRLDRAPQTGAVLLADPGWHQGVVGIVASRLCEKYGCPAFMVCLTEDGMGKGSCRSRENINLFELLSGCSELLEGFGGHALAAGFTVRAEQVPELARRLRTAALETGGGQYVPTLAIDAVIQPQELTLRAVEELDRLEPCGTDNPRPVLALRGALVQTCAQVGHGRHLKLRLEARGVELDAIFFSADGAELGVHPGCRVDVAFYPQINEFRGVRSVQLQVVDLRPAMTRAQAERAVYQKYYRGSALTADEARTLLPTRREFVALWRYLQRESAGRPGVEDTAARIARGTARATGQRETLAHTLLCLDVFAERGLICLSQNRDNLFISFNQVEEKVDLDDSAILRRLRAIAGA